jgi:hypothetical protein
MKNTVASAAPNHVDEREVDEQSPPNQEHQIRLESHSVGERPADKRRRYDREHHLISNEHIHWYVGASRYVTEFGVWCHAMEERHVQIAIDTSMSSAET